MLRWLCGVVVYTTPFTPYTRKKSSFSLGNITLASVVPTWYTPDGGPKPGKMGGQHH